MVDKKFFFGEKMILILNYCLLLKFYILGWGWSLDLGWD